MLCAALLFSAWVQAQQPFDALLESARSGDYAPALVFLREQQGPLLSSRYLVDHLLIAGWAGEDAEVTALYEQHGESRDLPVEALAAVARSYRNQHQWPAALTVYRQALQRFPDDPDLLLGQVLALADTREKAAAIAKGRALVEQAPRNAERRLALGYAYLRDGQPYAALREIDRAHELVPERADVAGEYLLTLQRAGLPQQALRLAQRQPGLLDAAQLRSLHADVLAERVRFADTATRRESERFLIADRALADSERLLQDWADEPQAKAELTRVRIDRLGALHARVRMAQLITEYQQLNAEQLSVPTYALRWVASAYLYLREPEQAAALYRQVIVGENNKHPNWLEDHRGLFYSLVESEQLEAARVLAEQLAGQQPGRLLALGSVEAEPNEQWLEAQELLASAHLYVNDTPAAGLAFASLTDNAPNNSSLGTAQAGLYLARGWPRRAEDELKVAESTSPRNLALEVEQGLAALQLQEWRQLEALADDVIQRYPESLQAQRLDRLRRVQQMAELRVSGYGGLGSGNSVSGSNDLGIDSLLFSPPINEDWRLFGGAGYATGDFEEGRGQHRWQRTGAEWRVRNHIVEAEVSRHDFGHNPKLGVRLSGGHDLDDIWQYGWSVQRFSAETPLRALKSDITANSLGGYVRWRGDERREWRLSATASRFSDDNERVGLLLGGSQRLYTAANWQTDLGLEVAASHNSNSAEVPYFNPKADLSILPSVGLSHTLYRRYQTEWSQQAQVGVGGYSQRKFGSDAIAMIGYGQRLRLDDRFEAGIAVSALSRPYDGEREREYRVLFDVNYRF